MISEFRNLELSFFYYIKDVVLEEWKTTSTDVSLDYETTLDLYRPDYSSMMPKPNGRGRGWSYFDAGNLTSEQTSRVVVSPGSSSVEVNYVLGGLKHLGGPAPNIVTFNWNYVAVIDEWPQEPHVPELPFVSIEFADFEVSGFQLGGGRKRIDNCRLHIFASSKSERDDLTNTLYYGLYHKHLVPQDFSYGTPLDFDGTFNSAYRFTTISGSLTCSTFFENVVSRRVNVNQISEVNRFRSRIDFSLNYFRNS